MQRNFIFPALSFYDTQPSILHYDITLIDFAETLVC